MLNDRSSLNLQSWLPLELHPQINALLVGFGQVTVSACVCFCSTHRRMM